ncbi:zinc finger MYM-type protein 1-like [Zingiber officinale]|uniref:zinc finger MYM-type protein 1-like n=1 Tax=Zingiber officinale TaxID=94328 RepID=UPI001C4AFC41|nr:zinc finger MYM-type protein 1-like [Zingiber officinale]
MGGVHGDGRRLGKRQRDRSDGEAGTAAAETGRTTTTGWTAVAATNLGSEILTVLFWKIAAALPGVENLSSEKPDDMVKDILFEPVRKAQDATHFYMTSEGMWLPCGPRNPGAHFYMTSEGKITMLRYFKKIRDEPTSNKSSPPPPPPPPPPPLPAPLDADSNEYPSDPGLRKHILEYNVNEREIVRRYYLQKEYSIAKDAAFCLYCYLFKADHGGQSDGDSFVTEGFKNWRKKEKFNEHVGNQSSIHNRCMMAAYDLMNQKQHIETCLVNQSSQVAIDYRVRLTASIDCIRFLVRQGLAFRGHDESTNSLNHGNFLELLRFLADHNEDINRVALDNAPSNLKLTSPDIQKDIIRSIAYLTTNSILGDLGDELFTILVDEARDISVKEQMAVALRFVDERGNIVERFLGLVHVSDTTALSLKTAINSLLCQHGLSISNLRGQGYDGASNMRGEFNGLKSLIMMENPSAYYVHCFAHQLQLTLVAVAENHIRISTFFDVVAQLNNIVGASCKRRDILREKQFEKVIKGICNGDIFTGQEEGKDHKQRAQANNLLELIGKYEFIFQMHLMKNILGVTNDLSQALQRKDQDIVNAMIHELNNRFNE